MAFNLPNLLTWLRLLAIPLLVGLYWPVPLLSPETRDGMAASLFAVAAVTDWFDGWLARRLGQTTAFGAFLDPVADKLIVAAALLLLLQMDRVDSVVALIIIGREITISALREWMASIGARANVAVHSLGKMKTAAQLTAITLLLQHAPVAGIDCARLGTWLIYAAAVLTIWSMLYYLRQAWPFLRDADKIR